MASRRAVVAVGGVILALVALLVFHVASQRAAQRAAADSARAEAAAAREARAKAEQELKARTQALERLQYLRSQVNARWLKDVEAAHAFGAMGVVPPMLSLVENGSFVEVTNLHRARLCVLVERVSRTVTEIERCRVGGLRCSAIEPGATVRLQMFRAGNPPACLEAPFEFRIGSPSDPEPSWWSQPALREAARFGFGAMRDEELDDAQIAAETARLNTLLSDTTRAQRWRAELSSPRPRPARPGTSRR
jgi:hypothetical protein